MELKLCKKKSSGSSSMLAPGFRFHPTDEELVRYYLRRKVCGKSLRFDAISEIDIYKTEPWDLPYMSKLKTRDLEWYFFSVLDKKYGNRAKTNRATGKGYWKTTGKDRVVYHKTMIAGMKKTLVYHSGRAPKGQRTNWVMHEYRLADLDLKTVGIPQDSFVLCRVFQKSGSGPKNGEQYGAPFVEEEWDDDELKLVPQDDTTEEVDFSDDAVLDDHDLQQILGSDIPSSTAPIQVGFQYADGINVEEITASFNDTQKLPVCSDDQYYEPKQCDDNSMCNLPVSCGMDVKPVKQDYIGECSKSGNFEDLDNYLLDEPFMDSFDTLQYDETGFIETNDLSNPIPTETDTTGIEMLDEYLSFLDASDDNSLFFTNDPALMLGSEEPLLNQALLPQKELGEGIKQAILPAGQLAFNNNNSGAPSSVKQEPAKYQSDSQYSLVKQASQMLSNIPAPPAFAAEFPSKDAILRFSSVPQPASLVQVNADMIQLRKSNMAANGTECSGKFNVILSFGFSQSQDRSSSLETSLHILPGKTFSSISRSWLYFVFFWFLILSLSFKIGTYVCAT